MRRTIRLLACIGACASLLASAPTRANAAPADVASLWAAPTHLQSLELRYGDYDGYIDAYRAGAGAGSARVCLELHRGTAQADGTTRVDSIFGCQSNAKNSAYTFDPVRWKAALSVSIPVERNSYVDNPDGSVVRGPETSFESARVTLRWNSSGATAIHPSFRTTYSMLRPAIVGVRAQRPATVTGTITVGRDVVAVNRVKGIMEMGGETP